MTQYNNIKGFNNPRNKFDSSVIYLIRHGECLTNIGEDVHDQSSDLLTEKGQKQAIQCGKALKDFLDTNNIMLYTSGMTRAIQTGEIIGQTIGITIAGNEDKLNEISHYKTDTVDGKLDYANVFNRIDEAINQISNNNCHKTNIIVTHQGVLELLICRVISKYYTGLEFPNLNITSEVDFKIHANTGISCFSLDVDGKINGLISWNNHNHI